MKVKERVFVVVNPTHKEQPALDRAITNAKLRKLGEELGLVVYITVDQDVEDTSANNTAIYCTGQWFQDLMSRINELKIESEVIVSWSSEWRKSILNRAKATGVDLLMMSLYPDAETKKSIFSEEKWFLLRNSEIPILMVRPGKPERRNCILAAIKEQDESYSNLNKKVITRGKWAADLYGADLHIVNSYKDSRDYPNRTRMLKTDLPNENIHIKQGDPADVVAEVANEIQADTVLIGTKQRTGLRGVMKGNTIERLIKKLPQDLMTQVE